MTCVNVHFKGHTEQDHLSDVSNAKSGSSGSQNGTRSLQTCVLGYHEGI